MASHKSSVASLNGILVARFDADAFGISSIEFNLRSH